MVYTIRPIAPLPPENSGTTATSGSGGSLPGNVSLVVSRRVLDQHLLYFLEQFGRLKWLGENLKPLKDLAIFEAGIVEKPTHQENRNSGAHLAQIHRCVVP